MKKFLSVLITVSIIFSITAIPSFAKDNLLLHYDFSSEEIKDVSGNGNNGKIKASADIAAAVVEDGKIHIADGAYVEMPEGILSGKKTATIAINLMPEIEKVNMFTWNFGNSSTEGYMFLNTARGDGKLRFGITKTSYSDEEELICDNYVANGTWTNIIVVIDGKNSKLYRDGKLEAQNELTLSPADLGKTTENYIGKSPYSADKYVKGYIDDFRIYDTALTESEVKALSDEYQAELADYLIPMDFEALKLPSETSSNLALPDYGRNTGADITWISSDENIIAPDGAFNSPSKAADVTLTASITYGGKTQTKGFTVKTLPAAEDSEKNIYLVAALNGNKITYYISKDGKNYWAIKDSALFRGAVSNGSVVRESNGFFYIADKDKAIAKSADLITWIKSDETVNGESLISEVMPGSLVMITRAETDKLIESLGDGSVFLENSEKIVKLLPDKESPFGEWEGWGTSLCWWANYLGYSEKLTNEAAKAVFNPVEGLGLNIARYNIGGGDDPSHNHITRLDSAVPGYMNPDGTYNWDADKNQLNVLKAAVSEGVDIVEAFSNSAPYFMTISGCSSGNEDASKDNLKPDMNEEFADYLTTVVEHLENEEGIDIDSISPMNEPHTNYWGANSPKQEGMHVEQGESQSRMIEALADSMKKKNINAVISATEETSINTAIDSYNALSDKAKDAVGRINTHTYSGNKREELRKTAQKAGKGLWMSEVDGTFTAGTNAGFMNAALGLAHRINIDVNQLQPTAWVVWQAIDSHKKSGTIYETNSTDDRMTGFWGIAFADHDKEEICRTKKYYGFGQYTRYIREGDTIISNSDSGSTLAAYNKNSGKIVIVASNTLAKKQTVTYDLSDFEKMPQSVQVIRTSPTESWAELEPLAVKDKSLTAELAPNSITTFVIGGGAQYMLPILTGDAVLMGYDKDGKLISAVKCTPEQSDTVITLEGVPQDGLIKLWIWENGTLKEING